MYGLFLQTEPPARTYASYSNMKSEMCWDIARMYEPRTPRPSNMQHDRTIVELLNGCKHHCFVQTQHSVAQAAPEWRAAT